jgi:hypothetical protein
MCTLLKTDSIGIWQFGQKENFLTSGDENPPKSLYFLIFKIFVSLLGDISPLKKEGCF